MSKEVKKALVKDAIKQLKEHFKQKDAWPLSFTLYASESGDEELFTEKLFKKGFKLIYDINKKKLLIIKDKKKKKK